jgi:hypothetical protein
MSETLLPVVQALNTLPSPSAPWPTHSPDRKERYVPFHLTFADYQARLPPVGILRPQVVDALQDDAAAQERAALEKGMQGGEGVLWQFFMSAFPDQSLKKVEKDGSDSKVRTKMANMEVGGEADRDELDEGEVLQTRVECVFLSDWALQGG